MNKKAQEEIAGFVLIVVIVIIISIIILGISIRQDNREIGESRDIYQFLESMMQYTTDCALSYEPAYSKLGELIERCNSGLSICISGKEPCDVARDTLTKMVDSAFYITGETSLKGYEFKSIYSLNNSQNKELIVVSKGECLGSTRGSELPIHSFQGDISNTLKLCY
ncbi:MAG: hypothetical protein AABX83_03870 [Nanoarchaeota archaeon]